MTSAALCATWASRAARYTQRQIGAALHTGTGAVRWTFSEQEMTGFRTALGGVVFWNAYQGEPHFLAVYAFDAVTGKRLYRLASTTGPLGARGEAVLIADASFMGSDEDMLTGTGLALPGLSTVSRLDIFGNVLYLGRTSGSLLAYDAARKKSLYAVRLSWPSFGPTFRSGDYTLLTTPGVVAVVREPR